MPKEKSMLENSKRNKERKREREYKATSPARKQLYIYWERPTHTHNWMYIFSWDLQCLQFVTMFHIFSFHARHWPRVTAIRYLRPPTPAEYFEKRVQCPHLRQLQSPHAARENLSPPCSTARKWLANQITTRNDLLSIEDMRNTWPQQSGSSKMVSQYHPCSQISGNS